METRNSLLLVDTNSASRKELSSIIFSDFNVVIADKSDDVLSLLQDESKNISVAAFSVDVAEPFLIQIRDNPLLSKLPVLLISNTDTESEDELISKYDIIYFLRRPFSRVRVRNALRTAKKLADARRIIMELERDPLTGLLTRQAFLRKAEIVRKENPQKPYYVVACDFDNFKSSNSLYGEEKCNEFLAFVGEQLKLNLPDSIIGRFGGDQFILFAEYTHEIDLKRLRKIRRAILENAPIPHQVPKVGIYAPIDFDLPLLICCDRAFLSIRGIKGVYKKDVAFYEEALQKQLLDEQRIIESMERGFEEEQFRIFYQPKHEAVTGSIAGAEALVRWEHPEYGFLSPGQFIPIFERNGFISKLDLYILTRVCMDIKHWQQNGLPVVPVSVNISRRDFMEPGYVEREIQIIDSFKIDHSLLHMEVTESLYSDNTELIISQVRKFQDAGFLIEMDDFGAGYSSLGALASFPLNVIKLDISFVRNIKANEIVIENVIKMAHRMGLLTVAEGAESIEQYKTLKSLGCDFIQGFYFSKPLSSKNYESYLKKSSVTRLNELPVMPLKAVSEIDILSENMLRATTEIAESIPGGFFSYHADGNLELISFNRELMRIYGCESSEELRTLCGNSFKGLVYEEDFERIQKSIINQINVDNDMDYVEYRIKTKQGLIKKVKDFGRFVHTEKYGDIFYVFVNDLTEEERKDSEILDSKNANKAKTIFMYNMVQEILKPTKSIISGINDIRKNLDDKELVLKKLEETSLHEENLLNYVNKVLEYAKIERGEITVDEIATDVSDAVQRTYELIGDEAERRGIKLEYWMDVKNPYIYQDIFHSTDVVTNILYNAMKYTPRGGTIKFGLRQLPAEKPDECIIQFECIDNGIGISKQFLPHVFDAFEREDNEINRANPSSGLGLNVAKVLTGLMGGTIEIESEEGKGTSVRTSFHHRYADKADVVKASLLIDNLDEESLLGMNLEKLKK
ncbi:MAG: EAL domain-containing protein [Treponema sp.]|nr:EAL domain-containing protein [Treponema sp.]